MQRDVWLGRAFHNFLPTQPEGRSSLSRTRADIPVYSSSVQPLSGLEINYALRSLAPSQKMMENLLETRERNVALLHKHQTVCIVLDGRGGWLGDMLEASRLVTALRAEKKHVIIATPNQDLFTGSTDEGISIIPMSPSLPVAEEGHWNRQTLKFLRDNVQDTPVLFPLNGALPVLTQINKKGEIDNIDTLELLKYATRPSGSEYDIIPNMWWKRGIHQLQALQIMAHMIGLNASVWNEFPNAYLHPNRQALSVAEETMQRYVTPQIDGNRIPVLIHMGVATNGQKLRAKFYPEGKWKQILDELQSSGNNNFDLFFAEPSDPQQAEQAYTLARYANGIGLAAHFIPMNSIKDWSVGAFIAFLQQFSHHRGIVFGNDSMPAGHASPTTGNTSVVLGSPVYHPGFYCPGENGLVILPNSSDKSFTTNIDPKHAAEALMSAVHQQERLRRSLRLAVD